MKVLSLFDGMSCGQQALERQGIKVDEYFASEIDKYAIQVTMANYPNTVQLGSVVNVDGRALPKIDLLIGGSPCQSFSFAGKRKGMSTKDEQEILTLDHYLQLKSEGFEFEGQSYLFWEYMRLLGELREKNPNILFLLENVMMGEKWEKVLSKAIGVNPIMINSSLVSAQNRQRLYWTNIGMIPGGLFGDLQSIIEQPKDKGILLKDILQDNPNPKAYLSDKMIKYINNTGTKNFYYKPEYANIDGKAKPITTVHDKRAGSTNYIFEPTPVDEKYYLDLINNKRLIQTLEKHNPKQLCLIDSYNQTIHEDKSITISTRVAASNSTHIYEKIDKNGNLKSNQDKASCFTAGGNSGGNHSDMDLIIVHNTMPRSSKTGKGGTGPLSRNDAKTYCLDTGQTNAIEIVPMDFRYDEGFRPRENGKSPTLTITNDCNSASGKALAMVGSRIRRLTPIECERLQTVKDGYTAYVSDSQRYKMLGNGWTVDVIAHIFSYIK